MRIFASKSASIVAIKRKNKQFADWWNGWAARIERAHARVKKRSPGTEVQETTQGSENFQFRNLFRMRKILEGRGQ